MSNISNNNFNTLDLNISKSEYWDFVLSKEKDSNVLLDGSFLFDDTLISYVNMNDDRCIDGNSIYSLNDYKWVNSVNNGLLLSNFGFNGIDNGGIMFDKNNITSNEFVDLISSNDLIVSSGDTRLKLNIISGNTGDYTYPLSFIEDLNGKYIKLEGGFYQGFFKSGNEYSVLPDVIQDEISFEFILKPDLITIPQVNTLNYKHINNKGIFFYLGVRSENKFWYEYVKTDNNLYETSKTGQTTPLDLTSFVDTHIDNGFSLSSQNIYDIETDNKYLLFNRTLNGLVASSFDNSVEYHITGNTKENLNYYQYINRTATGYTASNIDSLSGITKPYSLINDIVGNVIAFRIKDDGSIGYRTINKYCTENSDDYTIDEEYSPVNVIRDNEITFINVRLVMNKYSECGDSNRNFKLWFYVNGSLVFISKELPELLLRSLNDTNEKQESIPYNISIGGGSQGLCDMIGFTSGSTIQYLLPIEKYFAGSLIGSIYQFKIYYGKMDYSKIQNNYKYQSNHIFNPGYVMPTIDFWVSGNTSYPETIHKREIGNTLSYLNGSMILNDVYNPITGYKLYCYPGNNNRIQLNGLFNIDPSGGTIQEYIHDDSSMNLSGLTTIKYMIEVLDTYNNTTGTEKLQIINFDNMIFYGGTSVEPVDGNDIRLLQNKLFNLDTTEFVLETGAINNVFVIAVPSNRSLFTVYDQMALMMDITYLFTKYEFQVPDAGGKLSDYNVYVMKNAIPYNRNHNFIITLN